MSAKILIVEDEIIVAMALRATLTTLGYRPIGIAADLQSATAIVDGTTPDLALVDLNLRDGLTGPDIGKMLSRDHKTTVLFVTANPRLLGDGIAGTVGVLTKPTDPDAIEAAVHYALRLRNGDIAEPPAVLTLFKVAA